MHQKKVVTRGRNLEDAKKVLVMLHGRGANAEDILSLASYLHVKDFALVAPQATSNTWYPYSFLAPPTNNEPWLSSAIKVVGEVVADVMADGFEASEIYFLGFSQGACLALEYVARNAQRYGGVVAFTGGLIGDKIYAENYAGDFGGTPVFIGSSNPDPHVPVERVKESVGILKKMNADVHERIYNGMGHTINEEEITLANELVFDPQPPSIV
jgi:phospholipase/carboxylesterase